MSVRRHSIGTEVCDRSQDGEGNDHRQAKIGAVVLVELVSDAVADTATHEDGVGSAFLVDSKYGRRGRWSGAI